MAFPIVRQLFFAFLIASVYFCGRTFYAYLSLSASNKPETTAVKLREWVDENDFFDKLQHMIREEVKELQVKERLISAKMISRLTNEYRAKLVEQEKREIEQEEKTSPAFSFRVHMNFSRLFGVF